jgi:hypothetical protein
MLGRYRAQSRANADKLFVSPLSGTAPLAARIKTYIPMAAPSPRQSTVAVVTPPFARSTNCLTELPENYNTGRRIGYQKIDDARIAHISSFHDAKRPSELVLPLAAVGALGP